MPSGWNAAGSSGPLHLIKLNDVDPRAWLAYILRRLLDHPAKRIHELLPWNWSPEITTARAA